MTVGIVQHSPEWHATRSKNVGASEVAALFGCQADYAMSHWTLWQVKAGRMSAPVVDGDRPKWGIRLERVIAEAWCEERGADTLLLDRGRYVTHPHIGGMGCSPDFLVGDNGLLECKNVDWLVYKRQWDGEPPPHILLQAQHQLSCTGRDWCEVVALIGGNDLRSFRIDRRAKIIDEIELRVRAFWSSIKAGNEPAIDGSDSTAHALRAVYPGNKDEYVDLSGDDDVALACRTYQDASAEEKDAGNRKREAANIIARRMENHTTAVTAGYRINYPVLAGAPDWTITDADVGKTIKGRAASRRMTIKECIDAQ